MNDAFSYVIILVISDVHERYIIQFASYRHRLCINASIYFPIGQDTCNLDPIQKTNFFRDVFKKNLV